MRPFYENKQYQTDFPVSAGISVNMNFLAHWHKDIELVYMLEGEMRMGINQDVRIIKEGDLAICSSNDIHFYDSRNMQSKFVIVIFRPFLIGFPEGWPPERRFSSSYIPADTSSRVLLNDIKAILLSIKNEFDVWDIASKFIIIAKLYEFCGLALRHFPTKLSGLEQVTLYSKSNEISAMYKILNYVDSHFNQDISLRMVAAQFSLSDSYLSKLFKKTIGMNFTTYLFNKKILKAENLLLQKEYAISEIAFECGFNSIRTFNRVFKAINGSSPSAFRKH